MYSNAEPPPGSTIIKDPYEVFLSTMLVGCCQNLLTVMKESSTLCSILLLINHHLFVESILNPGSQVISMAEEACHSLRLIYDPKVKLSMQSANSEIDETLGLTWNIPIQISKIMLYLQFYIVRNPAYDILLGRPFDILVESIICNFENKSQMVTIYDPNTGKTAMVLTFTCLSPTTRFLQLKDLIGNQGDVALVVEYDNEFPTSSMITAFSEISPSPSSTDISLCYFEVCDTNQCTNTRMSKDCSCKHSLQSTCMISSIDALLMTFMAKKKYKLVAQKVQLILDTLPLHFCIKCNITGDPLADLPTLSPHPPPFAPCGHYTEEWCTKMDNLHSTNFLWPTKRELLHHFVSLQNEGFTWDDSECGHFHRDFFLPIKIPIVVHTPWVKWNIPILPGIYNEVCRIIRVKMDAGVYEQSNSSYRWYAKGMTKIAKRARALDQSVALWGSESAIRGCDSPLVRY